MGRVEDAGKRVRDQARVLKDQVEYKCRGKIGLDSDVMQWLVRWSAMVITRFKVGKDGKTAWERMKGKRCDLEVVPFGEKVWYKKLKESGAKDNKMESRWEEGIWMGHMGRTTEAVIGTTEGVVKAWAVKRRLESERWDLGMINGVRGTPAEPVPGKGRSGCPLRSMTIRG